MLIQGISKWSQKNILLRHSLLGGFTALLNVTFLHETFLGTPQHSISLKQHLGEEHESTKHDHGHSVTSGQCCLLTTHTHLVLQ